MKKTVFFVLFFVSTFAYSQEPLWYGSLDASFTSRLQPSVEKTYYYINPFISKTFGENGSWGAFIESSIEPGVYSVSPGVLYNFEHNGTYHEIGIGPGFEFSDQGTIMFLNSYYFLETKANDARVRGKLLSNINYSYSKEWGSWWLGYAMYYPWNATIGIGIHSQTYAVTGPRIQYSFGGDKCRKIIWTAGSDKGIMLGISMAVQSKK